jgi:hypothetical protein
MKSTRRFKETYGGAVAAGLALATAPHGRDVVILLGSVLAGVFLGVVLPAVWSRKQARRRDARQLLAALLLRDRPEE